MIRLAACPVCQGAAAARPEVVLREDGIDLVRCAHCELVYSDPVPSDGDLAEHYDHGYDGNDTTEYERCRARAFAQYLELMGKHLPAGARVLDVGACFGTFVARAREAGFDARGVDISLPAVEHAAALGIPVERGSIEQLAARADPPAFDAVTMWDFMEHMPRPVPVLAAARRLLAARGGLLFCAVPDFRFQRVKVACAGVLSRTTGRGAALATVIPRVHLIHYTPETLRATLRRAGLRAIALRPGRQNAPKRKESAAALKAFAKATVRGVSELWFHATGSVVGQEIVAIARPIEA